MPAVDDKQGYLALTRKVQETLYITVPASDTDTEIEVTVFAVEHGRCRLGTRAPRTTIVERAELRPGYVPKIRPPRKKG